MQIDIPLKQWGRGTTGGYFCREINGVRCYCAMGFILKGLGFSDDDLTGMSSIAELPVEDVRAKVPTDFYQDSTMVADWIMPSDVTLCVTDTNDDQDMTDDLRQRRLARYLEPHGFDITFTEETPDVCEC